MNRVIKASHTQSVTVYRACNLEPDGVDSLRVYEQLRTLRGKLKSAVSDAQAALRAVEESLEQFNKST